MHTTKYSVFLFYIFPTLFQHDDESIDNITLIIPFCDFLFPSLSLLLSQYNIVIYIHPFSFTTRVCRYSICRCLRIIRKNRCQNKNCFHTQKNFDFYEQTSPFSTFVTADIIFTSCDCITRDSNVAVLSHFVTEPIVE